MKRSRLGVLAAVLLSCAAAMAAGKNAGTRAIVNTAVAAGSFQTLAKALQTADLVDTLKGAGPFTVFALTDDAFAKLPTGTLEDLLNRRTRPSCGPSSLIT